MPPKVDWTKTCIGCQYCCTYVSLPIDKPRTDADFDVVRWYLAHRNIHIYIDHDGDWLFLVNNVCENLTPGGCAIYEKRFDICRHYEADSCEMTRGEPGKRFFSGPSRTSTGGRRSTGSGSRRRPAPGRPRMPGPCAVTCRKRAPVRRDSPPVRRSTSPERA